MNETASRGGLKRFSAVLLSSAILIGAPGPLAVQALAESIDGRVPVSVSGPTVLPALPTAIGGLRDASVIPVQGVDLGADLSVSRIPVLPIVNEGPVTEPTLLQAIENFAHINVALPQTEASVSMPSPAGTAVSFSAANTLGQSAAPTPGQGGGSPSATDIKGRQDQVYDQTAKTAGASDDASAVAGDYTQTAPTLPLPQVKPQWKESEGPSAADLKLRFESKGMVDIGQVSALSISETLKPEPAAGLFKDITPENEALSYGKRLYMEVKTGLKQGRLVGEDVAWTDSEGRLNLYSPKTDATTVIKAPLGPIEKFVTSPHSRTLYVLAGGSIQKWDLDDNKAQVVFDDKVTALGIHDFAALRSDEDGIEVKTDKGQLFWTHGKLTLFEGGPEEIVAEQGVAPTLRSSGEFSIEKVAGGSRIWRNTLGGSGSAVQDLGTLPFDVKTITATKGRDTIFAVTDQGLVEWDMAGKRYRLFAIDGLRAAAIGHNVTLDLSLNGRQALVTSGDRLFYLDLGDGTRAAETKESFVRNWSEENPMTIKDGFLHIGEFTFPVQQRKAEVVQKPWYARLWDRITGKKAEAAVTGPALSEEDWKAVNLPSNKWAIYQTLKGFTLGQHVLYIGETGGGKTWMSEKLAKLIGRKLYMVSFTEYTKNQDLLFSRTFGEEGKNKTGKTFETVLQWLSDPQGGILLLDEMHKPLEGIAALNNVLQNLKYHMAGKDIVGDKKTHFVIGTMNPVKPPYKGEPPSGELSSRFGVTLEVNYLPRAEEAALLKIFYPGVKQEVAKRLVDIANDLRKVYPDLLPLPVAPRTLLQIVAKIVAFPKDDPVDAFRTTYNPSSIVQDPSIIEAIEKALAAHDLAGAVNPGQKKK